MNEHIKSIEAAPFETARVAMRSAACPCSLASRHWRCVWRPRTKPLPQTKARQITEAVAAAELEQLEFENMPRARIGEITRARVRAKLRVVKPAPRATFGLVAWRPSPVKTTAAPTVELPAGPLADLSREFDRVVAGERDSPEKELKDKMRAFGSQLRVTPWGQDYRDFSADPPVWWIAGLPVPKRPSQAKAPKTNSSEGRAGAYRLPAEKRTKGDGAVATDHTVRERIREIVAFDDIFDRERRGLGEHNDNATSRIAAITKANCDPDAKAWWVGDLPDRGLSGEALNNRLKVTFRADYNAFLGFRRHELISCERRVGRLSPSQPTVWSQPPKMVATPRKMVTTFLDWREALGMPCVSAHTLIEEYLVWRERYLFWREGKPVKPALIVCPSLS